ncbi:choloylglycine hydrolase family protein [Pseudovibrio sp. SPO723]|uniref:choloylglycine hydrolase family protein n=1 Tax=Nesiotobacter zosterae TaxID=392721 RepID=UPI0029C155DB|nr:choloylglycine hydrolase family protein [Pseudovibrio sp. SPO723]MDX5594820.1 choloylglycine hydrolase family protein [Pseudovibrio sp. SPO723]
MNNVFCKVHRRLLAATCSAALLISASTGASACTSFVIKAKDDGRVYGRTMEFGFETESTVSMVPRGFEFTATTGLSDPMVWQAKYAVIGMNAIKDDTMIVDGINEEGLAGGALYFPGFASYPEPTQDKASSSLGPLNFLAWVLTSFATVDEVRDALASVQIVAIENTELKEVPPLHFTLHDRSGKSIVIEPVNGELKVYDNPLGVMTNSPGFDWHLINLRNYVNLSPVNAGEKQVLDGEVVSLGQGSGMLGLPGDSTPPSRFVRASAFVSTVEMRETAEENLHVATHMLNNFDIPKGFIRPNAEKAVAPELPDYTQWSVMANLEDATYFVRDQDALSFNSVSFDDFDLDGSAIRSLVPPTTDPFEPLVKAEGSRP